MPHRTLKIDADIEAQVEIMQLNDMRAALAQNQANHDSSALGFLGLTFLAIFAGAWWQSWPIGLAAFFGPTMLLAIPGAGQFVAMMLGGLCAYLGYQVGLWFGGGWVYGLPIFFGLFGFGVYLSTSEYLRDLANTGQGKAKSPEDHTNTQDASTRSKDSLASVFGSHQAATSDLDVPKPVLVGAGLVVLAVIALSLSLLWTVYFGHSRSVAAAEEEAPVSADVTRSEPQPEVKPRTVTVANPRPSSYLPKKEPLRSHVLPTDITVDEWNRIARTSQVHIAEKWVNTAFPNMRSRDGDAYYSHYSKELADCVDQTVMNMDELGKTLAIDYAAKCIIIMGR